MILCVDTVSTLGSLCIAPLNGSGFDENSFSYVEWEKRSSHSEVITSMFEQLQQTATFQAKDLTHLAIDVGPGSFTGIRVGVSFVKTLAYCYNLPTLCLNSFEIMAHQIQFESSLLITIPAVRGHFYVSGFKRENSRPVEVLPPTSKSQAEVEILKKDFETLLDGSQDTYRPKASTIAAIAGLRTNNSQYMTWKDINPLYLRRSEAEEKLTSGLLKPIYST